MRHFEVITNLDINAATTFTYTSSSTHSCYSDNLINITDLSIATAPNGEFASNALIRYS